MDKKCLKRKREKAAVVARLCVVDGWCLHLRRGKVWLGHLVATLHHLVEPGVHSHARVGALA